MESKTRRAQGALGLFQFGYEDSVIAARTELNIGYVAELRKAWKEANK